MSALFFVRYLLECARPEDRDVELAVEVARWAEDFGVDWSRAPEGPQAGGSITPVIPAGDRTNSDPVAVNLLAAIAFEQLARATGDRLWAAKGEALAAAVVRARDPKSGYLRAGGSLRADLEGVPFDRQHEDLLYRGSVGCRTWAIQLLREYAALKTEEHTR